MFSVTPGIVAAVLFGTLLFLFLLKVPIAYSMITASLVTLLLCTHTPLQVIPQRLFIACDSFPFMAVPFFMLAGNLMGGGGISKRLVRFIDTLVGHFPGGLGIVAIVTSMFFAAISGSGAATTAAVGAILIPEMVAHKYDRDFSAATCASGGIIGIIIPPSIPLVTYGVLTGVSISKLFAAGFVPGILMGLGLIVLVIVISQKHGYKSDIRYSAKDRLLALKDAALAILMPVIVLGGIYLGYFTPTEAAVISCVYGFIIGFFVYRTLDRHNILKILRDSAISSAGILILIAGASLFGWILTSNRIPDLLANLILSITNSKVMILLLINILLLISGAFMDTVASLIILVPILLPVITALGISPIHFAFIMCVNLAIGMITPPFGACLFVGCSVAGITLEQIVKRILPFIIVLIGITLIITFVPWFSTCITNLMA